ncbi:Sodium/hydrogen exchanger [Aureobasidium pullulans]|uniref:Sodium/hydrogen exchanger n=1 Tax=Aureobasidium pullulans TaxID=5580 RepID=A0A4T0BS67_AURPU|nr:Sodium/hydrogen exchanger [Aureobasidium pullulans]
MALAALPYHEPGIVTILIQSSFLLVLNGINWILDNAIYCGLVGQILIGVAWGTPGANWLSEEVQDTVMQLGYLGLILIVYEGGLSTSFASLWSNIYLSGLVALIGITLPIGLSYVLMGLLGATPVQAFAAGAALCSTSLGTTFTILSTSGLDKSRLGVILSSAAMLDDVAGLVMVQVISNLGRSADSFTAITVIRPVFVSIAFAVVVPAVCWAIVKPVTKSILAQTAKKDEEQSRLWTWICTPVAAFIAHTLVLLGLVTGSTYAGTSNLFAAYIAGAVINWWDALVDATLQEQVSAIITEKKARKGKKTTQPQREGAVVSSPTSSDNSAPDACEPAIDRPVSATHDKLRGAVVYERMYAPAMNTILKPFFFASIGFSIPITQMFRGAIVWRGIVYTILMILGKLACGLVLVHFTSTPTKVQLPEGQQTTNTTPSTDASTNQTNPQQPPSANSKRKRQTPRKLPKPQSLYPSLMLGSAMVARGEIGFLISSLAESNGVFGTTQGGDSSDIFLVATWAILLCTIIGPVSIGTMVNRVRRLQKARVSATAKPDPLGGWGVEG